MKRLLATIGLATAMMLAMAPAASAGGQSAGTLSNAGWSCVPAGPNDWTHCFAPGGGSNNTKATVVKVFSVDGSEFLGTELLISAAVYAGQPCMTDDGSAYHDLSGVGNGPYARHHFDTGG